VPRVQNGFVDQRYDEIVSATLHDPGSNLQSQLQRPDRRLRDRWIGGPSNIISLDVIQPNELAQCLLNSGEEELATVLILDVRSEEFVAGHVKWTKRKRPDGRRCGGVVNIQPQWLDAGVNGLHYPFNSPVVKCTNYCMQYMQ
jgi:hypothetical protein